MTMELQGQKHLRQCFFQRTHKNSFHNRIRTPGCKENRFLLSQYSTTAKTAKDNSTRRPCFHLRQALTLEQSAETRPRIERCFSFQPTNGLNKLFLRAVKDTHWGSLMKTRSFARDTGANKHTGREANSYHIRVFSNPYKLKATSTISRSENPRDF